MGTHPSGYGYDALDRLTTLTHQLAGGAAGAYAYDSGGRLTSQTTPEPTVANPLVFAPNTTTYAYDHSDQLTAASAAGATQEAHAYDSGGNRSGGAYALVSGGGNELITGDGYTTITYDAEGNLTSRSAATTNGTATTTYTYDYRNRLVGSAAFTPSAGGTAAAPAGGATSAPAGPGPVPIYPGGGPAAGSPPRAGTQAGGVGTGTTVVATYTYDALDRRAAASIAGAITWTVWDGARPYEDLTDSGGAQTRFLQGDAVDAALAATDAAGNTRWYLGDRQGSVRDLATAAGADAGHLAYDAFGDITAVTANLNGAPAFAFDGMRLETQTGLYYDRARFYSPSTGRFLNEDPSGFAGGDANLYRFAGNSPQNGTDPTGLFADDSLTGSIGSSIVDGLRKVFIRAAVGNAVRDAFQAGSDALEVAQNFELGYKQGEANAANAVANTAIGVRNQAAAAYDCTIGAQPGNRRMGQMPPTNFGQGAYTEEDPISRSISLGGFHVAIIAGMAALGGKLPGNVPLGIPAGMGRLAPVVGPSVAGAIAIDIPIGVTAAGVVGGVLGSQLYTTGMGVGGNAPDKNPKDTPALDRSGKVHSNDCPLPHPKDFGDYRPEDLRLLADQLKQSTQERIRLLSELGPKGNHGLRLREEQDLIHAIEKYLGGS